MGTAPRRWLTVLSLACWSAGLLAVGGQALAQGDVPRVGTTTVEGAITPVIADHLVDAVATADAEGLEALVVRLDTPGGLVTSMRTIVQTFLNADVPVVVHVAPSGADAGSAGTFITLSAHVAAMAPATTIGAATPVDLQGGEVGDKIVENAAAFAEAIANARDRDVEFAVDAVRDGRSVTAREALEVGAIDLVTEDLDSLLDEIDGMSVEVSGEPRTLDTAGARRVELEMSGTRRLLQRLADPNLAFVFMSLGTLAIIYEIANPGLGAGGILGAVLLILAFFSLSVLPVNYAGVALIVLAGVLFVIELFVPGIGVAAAGGAVALVLGGLFLFQEPTGVGIDLWVLLPVSVVVAGLAAAAAWLVGRTRGGASRVASDALLERTARVHRPDPDEPARVVLDGTYWRVRPHEDDPMPLRDGDHVTVVDRDNIELIVAHTRVAETTSTEEQT